ncbi:MAG TPA: M3 family metallopeptidase [Beijerinckiaceae bacterium]|nr:M3 family metallopeptidase [Beijerinckiaceae bacterium]
MTNPFFEPWTAPFGAPPFENIRVEHFLPAFERTLAEHRSEIDAIASEMADPSFENTISALERSGAPLRHVQRVFGNLVGADASPELQAIEREMAPALASHWTTIATNQDLFHRIAAIMARADTEALGAEEKRVLELTHTRFIRAGAQLPDAQRAKLGEIAERLASLGTQFSQNVLKDEADYLLILDAEADLAGLPDETRAAAARLAQERGRPGQFAISLARSSVEPFLAHSERRDLRETILSAWLRRGENGGASDNRAIIAETIRLRAERAALLGYPTYAHFKLDDTMAETPEAVRGLLEPVWAAGLRRAQAERERLQRLIGAEGGNFELDAHDWRFYSEKVRRQDYQLDETELRAYLPLDCVAAAAFDTAGRLFGLRFAERKDVPIYHPDVRVFEAMDADGAHVALFYADYFARPSKRSGAWMSAFRGQHKLDGPVRPIIVNVMNFVKGGAGRPTLLGLDEARTLFHEFGHALHGMLSDVTYPSIAGTSVPTDFVELPSQLFEHWLLRPEVLRRFARHFETGAQMPEDLLQKVLAAATFNQGFSTVEYCASALVDLDLHMNPDPASCDPLALEEALLARIGMPDEIRMRHRAPHFTHVFSGDHYAAGYYSYLWSEVLDADAFRAFEETGDIFDPAVAARLRQFVLAAGNRRDPKEAYLAFRGSLPDVGPLLEKRGLV